MKYRSRFNFLFMDIQLFQHCWKVLPPFNCFFFKVKNWFAILVWGFLDSLLHHQLIFLLCSRLYWLVFESRMQQPGIPGINPTAKFCLLTFWKGFLHLYSYGIRVCRFLFCTVFDWGPLSFTFWKRLIKLMLILLW